MQSDGVIIGFCGIIHVSTRPHPMLGFREADDLLHPLVYSLPKAPTGQVGVC